MQELALLAEAEAKALWTAALGLAQAMADKLLATMA